MTSSKCQSEKQRREAMKSVIKKMILSCACILMLTSCGTTYSEDAVKEIINNVADDVGLTDVVNGEQGNNQLATIAETVLLEQEGVKITAKEYVNDTIWGEGIKVLIENTGDKNLGIGCNALVVNNYMITDLFSSNVAAGKKSNETIFLSSSELKAAGIEKVGRIEVSFHIYDSDSYETVFDTDLICLETSYISEMDVTPEDAGVELLNQNGIRIVGKVVDENSFWGTAVLLFLENTSGKNVVVSCENMSVNGFMVTPYLYSTIYDGKMSIDEITIMSSDLEENGITSIDSIELSFHVFEAETFQTIFDSEPIVFSAN